MDWPLFLYNTYEREVHDCIQKMLQPEAVFCDVGANVGCFTLLAAPLVGERGLVLGFEPQPDAFRRLQANLGLNHFDNVRLFPLALGAKEGEIGLYDGGANWTHCASVYPSKWHEHCSRIPVRMAALDALLEQAQIRRVDLIKIDVEGAELDVLTGATQCLRRCKPKLIIEINPTTMTAGGWRWGNLRDFLSPFGYRLCRLLDGGRIETLAPDLNIEVFTLVAV
ncbi:MAG: FkbM family methyltransferase [Verrucomicrobiota bacterium]